MSFVVVHDACALFGNTSRDLLLRVAMARLVQVRWTDRILDELDRALTKNRSISDEKLRIRRDRMNRANPAGLVVDYEPLVDGLTLPDLDDRHVLAAAIKCSAQVIVTDNAKDFPAAELEPWNIETKSPDDFILDLYDLSPGAVTACAQQIADSRNNPPDTIDDVLDQLANSGLIESAAAIRYGAAR